MQSGEKRAVAFWDVCFRLCDGKHERTMCAQRNTHMQERDVGDFGTLKHAPVSERPRDTVIIFADALRYSRAVYAIRCVNVFLQHTVHAGNSSTRFHSSFVDASRAVIAIEMLKTARRRRREMSYARALALPTVTTMLVTLASGVRVNSVPCSPSRVDVFHYTACATATNNRRANPVES